MNENEGIILTADELDAIGEIMNISMGSSATAVSSMLDRQVTITTPSIRQAQFGEVDCSALEPAILVKIKYVEGIKGTNSILLRRHDMKIILNLLMGADPNDIDDDEEFDEMGMSAACEVMNQMMGAAATALSEVLGKTVNISTPIASLPDGKDGVRSEIDDLGEEEQIVAISFQLTIAEIMDSSFSCYLPTSLARDMIRAVSGIEEEPAPAPAPTPAPAPAAAAAPTPAPAPPQMQQQAPPMQQPQMPPIQPQMQQMPPVQQMPPQDMSQQMPPMQQMPPQDMSQQMPYPPYGYPGYGYPMQPMPDVKRAQFPNFAGGGNGLAPLSNSNMNLLLNVPLEVSVVIGKAKRKIKDILDFGQGTVVELDKQTGAPAEILVNGQLLAHGDVIVIGDNFGIRVTEIVSTKELLESLNIIDVDM